MRHRLNNLYLIIIALMIGITGCTDNGDTQDTAHTLATASDYASA